MKTGSSVDRLTTAGKGLYDAALALSSTTGMVEQPVVLIETALRHVAEVLARCERLDQPMSAQTRLEAGLLLLGLDGCASCRERWALTWQRGVPPYRSAARHIPSGLPCPRIRARC